MTNPALDFGNADDEEIQVSSFSLIRRDLRKSGPLESTISSLKQSAELCYRNLAVFFLIALVLLITTIAITQGKLFFQNTDYLISQNFAEHRIHAFLAADLKQDDFDRIKSELSSINGLKSLRFIDQEAALQDFAEAMGKEANLVTSFSRDNPLPASFEVILNAEVLSPDKLDKILGHFATVSGVETVRQDGEVFQKLAGLTTKLRTALKFFVVFLVGVSFFLVSSLIALVLLRFREEVKISLLLGASRSQVMLPFLSSVLMIACLSGACGILISRELFARASRNLASFLQLFLSDFQLAPLDFLSYLSVFLLISLFSLLATWVTLFFGIND